MARGCVGGLMARCLALAGLLGLVPGLAVAAVSAQAAAAAARADLTPPGVAVAPRAEALPVSGELARLAIDTCLKRLNPEIDIGYERISARCPDLTRRIEQSGWSVWLPRDWKRPGNDLSAGGLRQLGELLAAGDGASAALTPASGARQLNVAALPGVLASLAGDGAAETRGWWSRTKAWLRDVFERGEEEDDDWFSRFVAQNGFSQVAIELVSYVALALVVVLAVIIVGNELRVSGVLRRLWRRFAGRRMGVPDADTGIVAVEGGAVAYWTLDEVEKADRALQPRLLLELIAWRLTEVGRLPQSRGLTVRELTHAARLSEEGDRERLSELARMSERVRFSDEPASSDAVDAALQGGRVLFERLSAGGALAGSVNTGMAVGHA